MNRAGPDFSFVIPLFNTGESLRALFDVFKNLNLSKSWEVIFIDDGSSDQTPATAAAYLRDIPNGTLIELARNYGEHAAVLEGLRHTKGRIMITMDDDLQNPLEEAVRIGTHLDQSEAEVVYGSYVQKQHHWCRNLGSSILNLIATVVLKKPVQLYLSSFRALRRPLVERIIHHRGPYVHLDGLILNATNRIEQLSVMHQPRSHGSSGYTLRKLLSLTMSLCLDFSVMPLRLASMLGIILCCLGLALSFESLTETLFTSHPPKGWNWFTAALSIFSGVQLLILSLMGEYIGRAFLTVSGKPQSHTRRIHHTSQSL